MGFSQCKICYVIFEPLWFADTSFPSPFFINSLRLLTVDNYSLWGQNYVFAAIEMKIILIFPAKLACAKEQMKNQTEPPLLLGVRGVCILMVANLPKVLPQENSKCKTVWR